MPKNPSEKQRIASRRNIAGHHGPKTEQGKHVVAENGKKNRGVKTAKMRAKVVAARHGTDTETFYTYAGCLECTLVCDWPSFSPKTTLGGDMPMGCLDRVLTRAPHRCFYYFEGICCASLARLDSAEVTCILDPTFLEQFGIPTDTDLKLAEQRELVYRSRIISFKRELSEYLRELRRFGPELFKMTSRKLKVFRELKIILRQASFCRFEQWRRVRDWDEALQWIAYTELKGSLLRPKSS